MVVSGIKLQEREEEDLHTLEIDIHSYFLYPRLYMSFYVLVVSLSDLYVYRFLTETK